MRRDGPSGSPAGRGVTTNTVTATGLHTALERDGHADAVRALDGLRAWHVEVPESLALVVGATEALDAARRRLVFAAQRVAPFGAPLGTGTFSAVITARQVEEGRLYRQALDGALDEATAGTPVLDVQRDCERAEHAAIALTDTLRGKLASAVAEHADDLTVQLRPHLAEIVEAATADLAAMGGQWAADADELLAGTPEAAAARVGARQRFAVQSERYVRLRGAQRLLARAAMWGEDDARETEAVAEIADIGAVWPGWIGAGAVSPVVVGLPERRSGPAPWPTAPGPRLAWLLTNGVALWLPTPDERREAFLEQMSRLTGSRRPVQMQTAEGWVDGHGKPLPHEPSLRPETDGTAAESARDLWSA